MSGNRGMHAEALRTPLPHRAGLVRQRCVAFALVLVFQSSEG
ncbi:hypothetical protein [Streptomyces fagopyri]